MVVKAPSGRGDQRRPTTPSRVWVSFPCSVPPCTPGQPPQPAGLSHCGHGPPTGESVGCRLCAVPDGSPQIGPQTPGTLRHIPLSPLPRGWTWEEECLPWKCPLCSWSVLSPWTPRGPPPPVLSGDTALPSSSREVVEETMTPSPTGGPPAQGPGHPEPPCQTPHPAVLTLTRHCSQGLHKFTAGRRPQRRHEMA